MTDSNASDVKPGYRQPWFWFVMAPLILVVFVCIGLLTAAYKGADDVVKDNYYKEGRMINQRIEEDQAAVALGLSGELTVDHEVGEVLLRLAATPMTALPEAVQLSFDHPIEADHDQTLILHKVVEGYYRAELASRLSHRWYIRLSPHGAASNDAAHAEAVDAGAVDNGVAAWRIVGEIDLSSGNQLMFGGHE